MELQEMVLGLKEELISVKIGKEQIEGEVKFLRDRVHMEEEEKKTIEESLMTEINDLRAQMNEQSIQNERFASEKNRLMKTITDLKSRSTSSDSYLQKISQLQKQNEELVKEKEAVEKNFSELTIKTNTLRKELSNSEDLQRDLISLSKSLQMGLESIRQAETEVRWQHPDDIKQCNTCKRQFGDTKDKVNCSHCGRIFCKAPCAARSVRRGARDYNVCDFCHTLLAHDSAPYFSTEAPKSPD
jgi:Rab GTPase-binding effector protein 1